MTERHVRGAVVLATNHDSATSFVFDVAIKAADILGAHFNLLTFLPIDPSTNLYVELLEARMKPGNACRSYVFCYLSAHGSTHALIGSDTFPVFDKETATHFDDAILVMTACLKNGQLAKQIVACGNAVAAIIGYKDELIVPKEQGARKLLGKSFEDYKRRFSYALLVPVESLLQPGCTVRNAREDALRHWGELHHDTSLPKEMRAIAGHNKVRLEVWGNQERCLLDAN